MTTALTPQQQALADAMSDVSETAYCAGWMDDTEYQVWRLLHGGSRWGMLDAEDLAEELDAVRKALEAAGCWIVWGDDGEEPIPLDEWEKRYAAHKARS